MAHRGNGDLTNQTKAEPKNNLQMSRRLVDFMLTLKNKLLS